MQRRMIDMKVTVDKFQSSPGQKAGCNFYCFALTSGHWMFQSSPGQKAGCNLPL